jgi:hypothetical protein
MNAKCIATLVAEEDIHPTSICEFTHQHHFDCLMKSSVNILFDKETACDMQSPAKLSDFIDCCKLAGQTIANLMCLDLGDPVTRKFAGQIAESGLNEQLVSGCGNRKKLIEAFNETLNSSHLSGFIACCEGGSIRVKRSDV